MTEPKHRSQIELSPANVEKLDRLVERSEASSRAEVVRKAVALLEVVVDAVERRAEIEFHEQDGTVQKVITTF